jgi:hypothetical protein
MQHEFVQHHDSRQLERPAKALGVMRCTVADLIDDEVEPCGVRRELGDRTARPAFRESRLTQAMRTPAPQASGASKRSTTPSQ